MLRRYSAFLLSILMALILPSACDSNNKKDAGTAGEEQSSALREGVIHIGRTELDSLGMSFSPFIQREVENKIEASGFARVEPQSQAVVTTLTGGHARKVYVREGQWVGKGDPLLLLEDPGIIRMQQDYLETQATIGSLQADYERQLELATENIASEKTLLQAEADYKSALARTNGLKSQLRMLDISIQEVEKANFVSSVIIRSPIEGGIATMAVRQGMYLSPETEAFEVINTRNVYIELNLFEQDVLRIKKDATVHFRVPDGGKAWLVGSVLFIGQKVKSDSRTVTVQVQVQPDYLSENILPGMFVESEIILKSTLENTLPSDAVAEGEGKKWVLLKENEDEQGYTVRPVEVISEITGDGSLTILNASGFPPGSLFVTGGVDQLISE